MGIHFTENSEVLSEELLNLPPSAWIVRPCEHYKEEYRDCRSIKERFHQYFIHGHTNDCLQWKTDYDSCMRYRKTKDEKALKSPSYLVAMQTKVKESPTLTEHSHSCSIL